MAREYPPSISGTLPSFYSETDEKGAVLSTTITVPFSMNKTVSWSRVSGFSLKIKTTNTDVLLGTLTTNQWDWDNTATTATFKVTQESGLQTKLVIGQHYKVQLAYIDTNGIVGFYSSIGVIKYTSRPSLSISGLSYQDTNINSTEFVGVYSNYKDPTERVYQYKFIVYNENGTELETSGWKLHNSYTDESTSESMDSYILKHSLDQNVRYRIQYSVITNNLLEIKSPRYEIMEAESINPELNAILYADLDYENACISVGLMGAKENGKEKAASGAFILTRASSDTEFKIWTVINDFRLMGQLPSSFLFKDYTIEHGVTYRYALQQYNDASIYSNRIYAKDVLAQFEDIYLYDGTRQLKIRFNAKVSSFKTNYLDTKKTTLGSQYPFIFRNGAVAYKEFPINGLLSYALDNDEYFITRAEMKMSDKWEFTTDIIDENITYERRFKLAVLDWLNDGNIKLFKSPTEGNYLVRLMGAQLTPIDQTSRMLHNFSCTANEVASFDVDNLMTYKFLNVGTTEVGQMRWATCVLSDFVEDQITKAHGNVTNAYKNINNVIDTSTDIFNGYGCYHVKISDAMPGTRFRIGDLDIVIGTTGQYEVFFEKAVRSMHLISTPARKMPGTVTYGVYSTTSNKFDTINKVQIYDVALLQRFGYEQDILSEWSDLKHSITRIYFARFTGLDVQPVADYQALEMARANAGTQPDLLTPYRVYHVQDTLTYYRWNGYDFEKLNERDENGNELWNNYSTIVEYGDTKLSVDHDNEITISDLEILPDHITIGGGVCAEISFQVKEIGYAAEADYERQRQAYLNTYETYRAYAMNYRLGTLSDEPCYIFNGHDFVWPLDSEKDDIPSTQRVWTINTDNDGYTNIDPEQVRQAYRDWEQARDTYFALLEEAIKAQEVELQQ